MNESEDVNESKFKIQNLTMRKEKLEPAFPKDGPIVIPRADWLSLDLHKLSTYLKTSLTGDPNDVRSRFNIEDYQDSGVPPNMYELILQNIDMIPNVGEKQDTMEAVWLKETILRSLERQGLTEAYYDSKGEEVASTRGEKGPWLLAPWAREFLKKYSKRKESDPNETKEEGDVNSREIEPLKPQSNENIISETTKPSEQQLPNKISWAEKKQKFVMSDGSEDVKMFSMEEILTKDPIKNNEIPDERNLNQPDSNTAVNETETDEIQYKDEQNVNSKLTKEEGKKDIINYAKRAKPLGPRLSSHYAKLNEFWINYRPSSDHVPYIEDESDSIMTSSPEMPEIYVRPPQTKTDRNGRPGEDKEAEQKKIIGASEAKEYISQVWENHRNRYKHLQENSPFEKEPPEPEFLVDTYNIHHGRRKPKYNTQMPRPEQHDVNTPARRSDESLKSRDNSRLFSEGLHNERSQIEPPNTFKDSTNNLISNSVQLQNGYRTKTITEKEQHPIYYSPRNKRTFMDELVPPRLPDNYSILQYSHPRQSFPNTEFPANDPYYRGAGHDYYAPNPYNQRTEYSTRHGLNQDRTFPRYPRDPRTAGYPHIPLRENMPYEPIPRYPEENNGYYDSRYDEMPSHIPPSYNPGKENFQDSYLRDRQTDDMRSKYFNHYSNRNQIDGIEPVGAPPSAYPRPYYPRFPQHPPTWYADNPYPEASWPDRDYPPDYNMYPEGPRGPPPRGFNRPREEYNQHPHVQD